MPIMVETASNFQLGSVWTGQGEGNVDDETTDDGEGDTDGFSIDQLINKL